MGTLIRWSLPAILFGLLIGFSGISDQAYSQTSVTVPDWIKQTAQFWVEGQISDSEFVNALEWMVKNGIIKTPELVVDESGQNIAIENVTVPDWIKNTVKFWVDGQISDSEFVNAITFLYKEGIVNSPNVKINPCSVELDEPSLNLDLTGEFLLGLIPFDYAFGEDKPCNTSVYVDKIYLKTSRSQLEPVFNDVTVYHQVDITNNNLDEFSGTVTYTANIGERIFKANFGVGIDETCKEFSSKLVLTCDINLKSSKNYWIGDVIVNPDKKQTTEYVLVLDVHLVGKLENGKNIDLKNTIKTKKIPKESDLSHLHAAASKYLVHPGDEYFYEVFVTNTASHDVGGSLIIKLDSDYTTSSNFDISFTQKTHYSEPNSEFADIELKCAQENVLFPSFDCEIPRIPPDTIVSLKIPVEVRDKKNAGALLVEGPIKLSVTLKDEEKNEVKTITRDYPEVRLPCNEVYREVPESETANWGGSGPYSAYSEGYDMGLENFDFGPMIENVQPCDTFAVESSNAVFIQNPSPSELPIAIFKWNLAFVNGTKVANQNVEIGIENRAGNSWDASGHNPDYVPDYEYSRHELTSDKEGVVTFQTSDITPAHNITASLIISPEPENYWRDGENAVELKIPKLTVVKKGIEYVANENSPSSGDLYAKYELKWQDKPFTPETFPRQLTIDPVVGIGATNYMASYDNHPVTSYENGQLVVHVKDPAYPGEEVGYELVYGHISDISVKDSIQSMTIPGESGIIKIQDYYVDYFVETGISYDALHYFEAIWPFTSASGESLEGIQVEVRKTSNVGVPAETTTTQTINADNKIIIWDVFADYNHERVDRYYIVGTTNSDRVLLPGENTLTVYHTPPKDWQLDSLAESTEVWVEESHVDYNVETGISYNAIHYSEIIWQLNSENGKSLEGVWVDILVEIKSLQFGALIDKSVHQTMITADNKIIAAFPPLGEEDEVSIITVLPITTSHNILLERDANTVTVYNDREP